MNTTDSHGIARTDWTEYRITGMVEKRFQAPDGASRPGAMCDHCGNDIVYCVQIQHVTTGDRYEIGTDCAHKVGMSADDIKAAYRQLNAARNAARAAEARAKTAAARQARELEEAGLLGAHGTESRYTHGCRCQLCRAAAPHGTFTRFSTHKCRCLDCITAAVTEKPDNYWLSDAAPVLINLETGQPAAARECYVDNRYTHHGEYKWALDTTTGTKWLATGPARRTTHTKHGVVEAKAPVLYYSPRIPGEGHKPPSLDTVLGSPLADIWGHPIPRPAA